MSEPFSITLPAKNERLSGFGKKDDRFLMVTAQSIISGGLRFLLKNFFVGELRELGIAPSQLS